LSSTEIEGLIIENAGVFGIVNGATSLATFRFLTLRNNGGNSSASGAFQNGSDYAFAILNSCVFENNIGTGGGAAFRNPYDSSFLIERCTFSGNDAAYGGAISNAGLEQPCPTDPCDTQPIPRVRLCNFDTNTATSVAGAIYNDGDLMLLACSITGNQAGGDGGAIQMNEGRLIMQDTAFVDNVSPGFGGAIYIARGCLLSGHSCLFAKNSCEFGGGAIYGLALNSALFQNCTVTDNIAGAYGGIYLESDEQTSCYQPGTVEVRVENSILWNNYCDSSPCGDYAGQLKVIVDSVADTAIVNYTCLEDLVTSTYDTSGVGNIPDDPEFRDPANNNWRLTGNSPCIDAADGEVIPQDGDDADGDSRVVCNGCTTEDSGEHLPDLDLARRINDVIAVTDTGLDPDDSCPLECEVVPDMGAYEFVACADCEARGDLNGDGDVNGLDIQPFTLCAVMESAAEIACLCGDFSGPTGAPDGVTNRYDIPCFIELLLTGSNSCSGPVLCGSELLSITDCNDNDIPDANDIAFGTSLDCNKNGVPDECDLADETSTDVNSNDVPDDCEPDCNGNNVPDDWDISEETSNDVNGNAIPDECEPDCNANDVPDAWDISTSASEDCNENGIPDECDDDCNDNDVPDACDIADSTSEDCNENGVPDECDLARSMLPSFDCNDNDVPDECDIANETSEDANENGIPDECEEESLWGGGGESMMSGGEDGGAYDAEAAWAAFYEWYEGQVFSEESDWPTLTGSQRFDRVINELEFLGLPYARPW